MRSKSLMKRGLLVKASFFAHYPFSFILLPWEIPEVDWEGLLCSNGVEGERDLHLGQKRKDQTSDGFREDGSQYVKNMTKAETVIITITE